MNHSSISKLKPSRTNQNLDSITQLNRNHKIRNPQRLYYQCYLNYAIHPPLHHLKAAKVQNSYPTKQIISQNKFYHLIAMRADPNNPNKILPIKSLVQSTKHTKKQSIQFTSPESSNLPVGQFTAHKTSQPYPHMQNHLYAPTNSQESNLPKQKIKGISVGNKNYSMIKVPQQIQKNEKPQKTYKTFQQYSYVSKMPMHGHTRHESDITKNVLLLSQNSVNKTPRKMENMAFEEMMNYRGFSKDKADFFKSVTLNKAVQEPDSGFFYQRISTKIEEQTWSASKFQKIASFERDSLPIFKDEVIKIKTQLFQKEALLFQTTQKLEQRQRTIKELRCKLEVEVQLNKSLKTKLGSQQIVQQQLKNAQGASQNKNFNFQIQRLNDEISKLNNEFSKAKEQKSKQDHEAAATSKLLQLKLKQFQLEQKERTHYIMQLKERQKRAAESYDKMLNGQRQLLRQKEEQLTQISQAAHFYKQECAKNERLVDSLGQRYRIEGESKELVIRQLSGEIGDLKGSLRNMEMRMRELIQNEDDLQKEIDHHNSQKQVEAQSEMELSLLRNQLFARSKQIQTLRSEKQIYVKKIQELENKLSSQVRQLQNSASLKEMQVSMMAKTCEQYKRKLDEYHKYSQQMRKTLQNYNQIEVELKKVLIEKEQEIHLLRVSYDSPSKSRSSQKAISPIKQGKAEDKEYNRLKNINVKLIKENERLNMIVKDLDFKIYQLYRVNESLNQIILGQLFKEINENLRQKDVGPNIQLQNC